MSTRSLCAILFWIKASFAIMLCLSIIFLECFLVYKGHETGKETKLFINSAAEITLPLSKNDGSCSAKRSKARLEPDDGMFLWGFSVQWDIDNAINLTKRIGKTFPIFNTFIHINNSDHQVDMLNWQAQQIQQLGAMMEISVLPNIPLEDLTDLALYKLAAHMRKINSYYGVPVYLRFGPEMNGEWMVYHGLRPKAFREKFRILAKYVYQLTNLTAMVWAPNIGGGTYTMPPDKFKHVYPAPGSDDFKELDSNGNGVIENVDESYSPYYPGDEYVDWIGLSLYNYARSSTGNTAPADIRTASVQLGRLNFLSTYVIQKNKPLMLPETGASADSNIPGEKEYIRSIHDEKSEGSVKQAWMESIISAANANPLFKSAVWFEEIKPEHVGPARPMRDFRITSKPSLTNIFLESIKKIEGRNVFVDKINRDDTYFCTGEIKF